AVRGAARLEGPAAHDLGARFGDQRGDSLDLVPCFHAARPCHDNDLAPTDIHVPDPHHRAGWTKAAAGQLVWRGDAVRLLHALHPSKTRRSEFPLPHAAENGVKHARGAMYVEAEPYQPVDHRLNLRLGRALLHYD